MTALLRASVGTVVGLVALLASPAALADAVYTLAATTFAPSFDSTPCAAASLLCQTRNGLDLAQLAMAAANAVSPLGVSLSGPELSVYAHELKHWPSMGAAWTTVAAGLGHGGIPAAATGPGMVQATIQPIAAWSSANFGAGAIGSISVGAMNLDTGVPNADFVYATAESLNVINIPEPSTWGMVLSGFALLGWIARRRVLT